MSKEEVLDFKALKEYVKKLEARIKKLEGKKK